MSKMSKTPVRVQLPAAKNLEQVNERLLKIKPLSKSVYDTINQMLRNSENVTVEDIKNKLGEVGLLSVSGAISNLTRLGLIWCESRIVKGKKLVSIYSHEFDGFTSDKVGSKNRVEKSVEAAKDVETARVEDTNT